MRFSGAMNTSVRASCSIFPLLVLLTVVFPSPAMKTVEGAEKEPSASSHHSYARVTRATTATKAPSNGGAVASACKNTLYPDACEKAFSSISGAPMKSPKELFDISVEYAMGHAHSARSLAYNLTFSGRSSKTYPPTGTYDCVELLDTSLELLNSVLDPNRSPAAEDIDTWLSAALTNQVTCSESLANRPHAGKEMMDAQAQNLSQFISNSLALHKSLHGGKAASTTGNRKLLSDGFPSWVSAGDRRLLEASPEDIKADAVVAQDGSGTHKTVGEAIAFVSLAAGGGRSVIYVKAGTYNENINIPTKQKNVMLMGDGKGSSVIVSSRSAEDGWTTYQSATVAAMGEGFIAKGLTIINNAGPSKHQAVALRVGSDRSVVYACSIQGYQDTLYTHSNRQFYRDNDIYGTVDFIFGNSAVVIQSCNISPRRPDSGQKNSVTAQGRTDPNQNTGISIHRCTITPTSDLAAVKHQIPTYLGRPWHEYSRTVVLGSYIDDVINPAGWEPWSGGFALSTLYYGEYGNTGPGASTSGRVRWPGVHPSMSTAEASKFTVAEFIFGNAWLPGTGVAYTAGL